jgi:predicted DNA-binding WGR domain protein
LKCSNEKAPRKYRGAFQFDLFKKTEPAEIASRRLVADQKRLRLKDNGLAAESRTNGD